MQLTLAEITERLGGTLEGDPSLVVSGVAGIGDAVSGQITFLANPKYAPQVAGTRATAVIVPADFSGEHGGAALIRVSNSYLGFVLCMRWFVGDRPRLAPGIHESAVVSGEALLDEGVHVGACVVIEAGARIGKDVCLMPGVFVGAGALVGAGTTVYPNVTLRERVTLGERCIIHSGTVIGSDGFGFVATHQGGHEKMPLAGTVEVVDDVEVGACGTRDRATTGVTRIGNGVKIDNLVHVAHNVSVGDGSLVVAQAGISGSTRIGKGVVIGGQAGLVGHIQIGDGAMIAAQAGVTKSVSANTTVSGYPAMEHARARRLNAQARKLPDLIDRLRELEVRIQELEAEREKIR